MSMDSKQPPSSPPVRALGEHLGTALDRAARAAEPPDYAQLAAYVDGTLDDVEREIVESWLDSDPELRAEVEDLRALHDAMAVPAATPVSGSGSTPASVSSSASIPPPAALPARTSATTPDASLGASTASASGSAGVLPFERKGMTRSGGARTQRFGTATVIMGAMAAAMIAAMTWLAVRTARVDDRRPGAEGYQAGRQPEQRQPPSSAPPSPSQPPPLQSPNANPSSSVASVTVRDAGGLIAIDATGAVTGLTADAATPEMTRLIADALTNGAVPRATAAAGLGARELTLMGSARQPSTTRLMPLSPIATLVRSAKPVFRWSAHPGARNYVVTIYGLDFDRVMASPVLTDTSWTASSPLEPGVTYQWQVTADTPEGFVRAPAPPAPDARFRIIDSAAGKTLDRDLARAGSSQLARGLLLAQAGVLDEAEQAFEALQTANPDSKRVAALLARVRERRLAP